MVGKLLLAGVLAATFAFAQRGGGGGDMAPQMRPGAPNRLDQWERQLKLSKEEKKQIKTILDDAQKEAAPLREEIAKSETELGDAIASGKSQDEIDKATNALGKLHAQMAALEMKSFAKIYQGLEKDQQPQAGPIFFAMQGIFSGKNWNDVSR